MLQNKMWFWCQFPPTHTLIYLFIFNLLFILSVVSYCEIIVILFGQCFFFLLLLFWPLFSSKLWSVLIKSQVMKKSQCKIVLIWSSFFMENKKFQSIPSVFFQSTLLSTLFRFFRRGSPSSPASGLLPSPQTKPPTPGSKGTPEGQEPFIQLVQAFVRHVQR